MDLALGNFSARIIPQDWVIFVRLPFGLVMLAADVSKGEKMGAGWFKTTLIAGGLLLLAGCSVTQPTALRDDAGQSEGLVLEEKIPFAMSVGPVTLSYMGDAGIQEIPALPSADSANDGSADGDGLEVDGSSDEGGLEVDGRDQAREASEGADPNGGEDAELGEETPRAGGPPVEVASADSSAGDEEVLEVLGDRPYSSQPELDRSKFQARIAKLLSWILYKDDPVATIAENEVRLDPKLLPEDPAEVVAQRRKVLCVAGDEKRSQLVANIDVLENRIAWVRRDGILWWLDAGLFWAGGILPIVMVADEVYEVRMRVRITILHTRTGKQILSREFRGSYEQALNNHQRGWSLTGALYLHPYWMDEADYPVPYEALREHALKDLEFNIAKGLREELPKALEVEEVRDLLKMGTEEGARTYAVLVGCNGPQEGTVEDPHFLRYAENDAKRVRDLLLATDAVESPDHIRILTGEQALTGRVTDAIESLGPQVLGYDRFVFYFSGLGQTQRTKAGEATVLRMSDGWLSLAEVAKAARKALGDRGRVLFLLDTSFAGKGGRTYPGGRNPKKERYLEALGDPRLNWRVLAAASSSQAAYELDAMVTDEEHGFFTYFFLEALQTGDQKITSKTLNHYLSEQLPRAVKLSTGKRQNPFLRGAAAPVLVAPVPKSS